MDNLGVRAFNRQHQFPAWAYLPQPDSVTNLNTLAVVDNLADTGSFPFLANMFNTVRVQVYSNSVSGSPLLDSGTWDSCDYGRPEIPDVHQCRALDIVAGSLPHRRDHRPILCRPEFHRPAIQFRAPWVRSVTWPFKAFITAKWPV